MSAGASSNAHLRAAIEARIAELTEEIDLRKSNIAPVSPDNAIGRLSRMEGLVSQEVSERALANAQRTLQALNMTLKRIDDDDFGRCVECDTPIPQGRLLAVPESRLCVNCASKLAT